MKVYQKIIDFTGMEFAKENHPSSRLRERSANYKSRKASSNNNVARNVKNIFQSFLGF